MSSVRSALSAMAPCRRLLPLMLLMLGLCTMQAAHAGKTYRFSNDKIDNCSRQGKVYTCSKLPMVEWDDSMVIENGITVDVTSDVWFGYDHGLSMSGSARLTSTGNLSIADIAPAKLSVSGGSFSAAGSFSVGNQVHTIKADINAGTLMLGSGSGLQITGTLVSKGAVQIGSNTTINGPVSGSSISIGSPVKLYGAVTSSGPVQIGSHAIIEGAVKGTVINADSPVNIKGDVTASSSFTLGSGSTLTGSITAPEVSLYASSTRVSGNVTASKSLLMGSSVRIDGDVDTGQLALEASDALIGGKASVDFARLGWHGKVSKKIYCKSGTRPGACDCVDNQTGWEVNTADGPVCESAKPATSPLHHFLITHDGSGRTCAPETVTVSACANAACTQLYTGGAQVTLAPGSARADIGSSGSTLAQVSRNSAGTENLTLSQSGAAPAFSCYNSASKSASCAMAFTSGVSFQIEAPHHRAGDTAAATITALESDPDTGQCVAAFRGETKPIQYSCGHVTPSSDTQGLKLSDTTTTASATLACATGVKQSVSSRFDAKGQATLALVYQDAGQLKLMADFDDAKGEATFTVAPYAFSFSELPTSPVRAAEKFNVTVTAVNKKDEVTPGFDKSRLKTGATLTSFSVACVLKGGAGQFSADPIEFAEGKGIASVSWAEVGSIDLKATLSDFLGSKVNVEGATNVDASKCEGKVGPIIPKYFLVNQPADELTRERKFYYAGEPIPVTVTAMNALGAVTTNYSAQFGLSHGVTLTAFATDGATANPGGGALHAQTITADKFEKGRATGYPEYWPAGENPTLAKPIMVKQLMLRARLTEGSKDLLTSFDGKGTFEQARPDIRSGRLRLGNVFGRVGQQVEMPIEAHYWTGQSWVLSNNDNETAIDANAFPRVSYDKAGKLVQAGNAAVIGKLKLEHGKGMVVLSSDHADWIDVAINLGGDGKPLVCPNDNYRTSTGAKLPYLRLPSGCRDPSARATFGQQAPENRRIIHVREVFN